MLRARSLALAAALLAAGPGTLHAQNYVPSSPSELRDFGREILAYRLEEHGRDTNPVWRRDVKLVIDSVHRAAAYRAHPLTWDITGDSSMNASAAAGGVMIVNVGLPLFCQDVAQRKSPANATAARRTYLGCLAAVIGHEFGHLALGHSDSVGAMIQRRGDIKRRKDAARGLAGAVADSILMAGTRLERARELEADEAGALYILRAGWEIQDAIDLFTAMELDDRRQASYRSEVSWMRGHPRGSERVARLEMRRARLKLLQTDFDDAMALVDMGVLPDSALAMLDRVLKDLPYLPAARHARATVLAKKWMATATTSQLKVRMAFPTYTAQFMTSIKGGDATALKAARDAFTQAMGGMPHPYTLSTAAVLDAYAGDLATARQRAEAAAQRMPNDVKVLINLGSVQFLGGSYAEARRSFERAEQVADKALCSCVIYNQARAAIAAGDKAGATRLVERYLGMDRASAWARELTTVAQAAGVMPATATPATGTAVNASAPAVVAGVRLGMPRSLVVRALGQPENEDEEGGRLILEYKDGALLVAVDPDEGVVAILLDDAAVGDVAGVKVGDLESAALRALGTPSETEGTSALRTMGWDRGRWAIVANSEDGRIVQLAVVTTD